MPPSTVGGLIQALSNTHTKTLFASLLLMASGLAETTRQNPDRPPLQRERGIAPTAPAEAGEIPCVETQSTVFARLPTDVLGREYRGQCVDGIEVWAWAQTMQARFGKAQNALFVVVVNRRNEMVSVALADFHVVSVDAKHPGDPNRAKVISALEASKVGEGLARTLTPLPSLPLPATLHSEIYDANGKYMGQVVSSNPLWPLLDAIHEQQDRQAFERSQMNISQMNGWIMRTAFQGGTISAGGHVFGLVYFGEIKGINPMLMYGPKVWVDKDKWIQLPLGNWDWH